MEIMEIKPEFHGPKLGLIGDRGYHSGFLEGLFLSPMRPF